MSSVNRVATNVVFARQRELSADSLADMQKSLVKSSSGRRGETWQDYGSSTTPITQLTYNLEANRHYTRLNSLVQPRLEQMSTMCTQLEDAANQLISTISTDRNGQLLNPSTAFYDGLLTDIAAMLNTSINGIYVFSGQKGDTPPVNLAAQSGSTSPNTAYFEGSTQGVQVQLSDTLTITTGVTAADAGFEKLLRATRIARDHGGDATMMEMAFDLATQAAADIAIHASVIGATTHQVEANVTLMVQEAGASEQWLGELLRNPPGLAESEFWAASYYYNLSSMLNQKMTELLRSSF